MSTVTPLEPTLLWSPTEAARSQPARQAFQLLYLGFSAAPILAGGDKFVGALTDWERYLSPALAQLSPLSVHGTMLAVGAIEVLAGLLVAVRPRLGALVVAAWLAGIIGNLLLLGQFLDLALRDLGLLLGALALARLSQVYAPASATSGAARPEARRSGETRS